MSLDVTPKPGSAPLGAMLRAQTGMELKLMLRNGEQVLLTLVIPLLLLVMGTKADQVVDLGPGRTIDIIAPGVLALAVLSTSFTSLAISTGFDRRYGVLKRLGASPLPRAVLLLGKVGAVAAVEAIQLAVLVPTALALGWEPHGSAVAWVWAVLLVVAGTAAFGALGLLIAGTLRAEATLAVANLVYVLLLVGGGLMVPLSRYPEGARQVMELVPSGALGEGLREAFAGGSALAPLAVLVVWAAVAGVATVRSFKWE
ncbi:ABC transporter permease [Aeromicrobium alkaliterrae]|uniref:Transport permease protein n=1 Tax=Aeromicrobium alkaliterrae TaxID=302168 RepID=A0ABP4VLI1_9ACTN